MIYATIAAVILLLYVVLHVRSKTYRIANKITNPDKLWEECFLPWTAHGRNGWRTTIYHLPTGTLIQIVKRLKRNYPTADVRLQVLRARIENPLRYDPEANAGKWLHSTRCSKLPSMDKGRLLEDVDCGASLTKLEATLSRMISELHLEEGNTGLFVWGDDKGTCPFLVLGAFEP